MKSIDALGELKRYVARYPTHTEAAVALGISKQYLSDMLNDRRDLSDGILEKLGLRRVTAIVRN